MISPKKYFSRIISELVNQIGVPGACDASFTASSCTSIVLIMNLSAKYIYIDAANGLPGFIKVQSLKIQLQICGKD